MSPRTHKCLRSCWADLRFCLACKPCANVLLNCTSPGPKTSAQVRCSLKRGDVAALFSPPAFNPAFMRPLPLISSLIQMECSLCGRCSNRLSMKPVCIILQEESVTGFIAVLDHSAPSCSELSYNTVLLLHVTFSVLLFTLDFFFPPQEKTVSCWKWRISAPQKQPTGERTRRMRREMKGKN